MPSFEKNEWTECIFIFMFTVNEILRASFIEVDEQSSQVLTIVYSFIHCLTNKAKDISDISNFVET